MANDDATMAGGIVAPNLMELLMQLNGQMTALQSEQAASWQAIRAIQENLATVAGGIVTPNLMESLMQLNGQMTALRSEQAASWQAIRALQENLAAAPITSTATSTAPTGCPTCK
jgi:nitrogen fixation protein FixH